MIAIIILFVFGVITMFTGFSSVKNLTKSVSLVGIVLAIISIVLKWKFNLAFDSFFIWNPLAIMMTFLSLLVAFFIILNSDSAQKEYDWATIYSLMLFSICGAILLFGYTNLLTLFLGIEILSIPLYVLASSNKNSKFSLEAGVKYFILGAFSSAFLLYGIALIYGTFGSFQLDAIMKIEKMQGENLPFYFQIGMLFILLSVFFKMALAPFHIWAPDVYEGSPTIVTTFMATIVKIAASISMYYLINGFFAFQANNWLPYVLAIVSISLIISGVMGLVQKNAKRLMAYSSVSHAAFIMMAIMIALIVQNPSYMVFYLISYIIASLCIFLIFNKLEANEPLFLEKLNGLSQNNPIMAICMAICILSMAGIPLTAGFIAKFNVLKAMYSIQSIVFVLAVLASALGMAYYLTILNKVFFSKSKKILKIKDPILSLTLIICAISTLILGLLPSESLALVRNLF